MRVTTPLHTGTGVLRVRRPLGSAGRLTRIYATIGSVPSIGLRISNPASAAIPAPCAPGLSLDGMRAGVRVTSLVVSPIPWDTGAVGAT